MVRIKVMVSCRGTARVAVSVMDSVRVLFSVRDSAQQSLVSAHFLIMIGIVYDSRLVLRSNRRCLIFEVELDRSLI